MRFSIAWILMSAFLFAGVAIADTDPAGLWSIQAHDRIVDIDSADRACRQDAAYHYRLPEAAELNYKLLKQLAETLRRPSPVWVLAGRPGEASVAVEINSGQRRQLVAGGSISPGIVLCRCAVRDLEFCSESAQQHLGRAIWISPTPVGSLPEHQPAVWLSRSGHLQVTDWVVEAPFAEGRAMCREFSSDFLTLAEARYVASTAVGSDWYRRIYDSASLLWTQDHSTQNPELKWAFRFADEISTFLHANGVGRVVCRKYLATGQVLNR